MTLTGDILGDDGDPLQETVELWSRNPLDIIKELLSNPAFADDMSYEPVRIWLDDEKTKRCYGDTNTADWMWELQVCSVSFFAVPEAD